MSNSDPKNLDYRIQLRELLEVHFNDDELQSLYFDLEIDYSDFRGKNKPFKIRELINHCRRHMRLHDLISRCSELRPGILWPEIPPDPIEDEQPQIEKLQEDAGSGIEQLAHSMRDPVVRDAVTAFKIDFERALGGIKEVRYYKLLHDLFQEMEPIYNLILHNYRPRVDEDSKIWPELIANLLLLQEPVDDLIRAAAENSQFVLRANYWLSMLQRGKVAMKAAIDDKDVSKLDAALRFYYRALDRGLPRVNVRLVDAAIDLPLDRLMVVMDAIYSQLKGALKIETTKGIAASVEALDQLDDKLTTLVRYHNDWQSLDDELRRVEANISNEDFYDLELTWPDIKEMTEALYKNSEERWAASLRQTVERLDRVVTDESSSPASVNRFFDAFRGQTSRRFRVVDDQLLELCQDLQNIGKPLDGLLSMIQ